MPPFRLIVAALAFVLCGFSHNLLMQAQQRAGTPATTTTPAASATTTTLQVSPASAALGSKFILSAAVTVRGGPEPAGTVSFYNGAALLGTADILVQANAHGAVGSASFAFRGLPIGANAITAKFNGTKSDAPSASAVRSVTVSGIYPSATTLAATGERGIYQLDAAVFGSGPGTPTGTVTFTDVTTNTTLGTAAAGAGTTTLLSTPTVVPAPGSFLYDVALGDLNGDGIVDMAFGGGESDFIAVALGNGDGTFAASTVVATSYLNSANAVTLADLNGDGNLDIIATSDYGAGVVVFLGNGDGTFGAENDYPVNPNAAYALAVADFNGDGKLDIATANYDNGTMSILLGNGDGTLQAPQAYATDTNPVSVTVGDYNGDGNTDAAVCNRTGTISLFLGNGDGTFAPQSLLTGSASGCDSQHGIATGDIDGDGKLDLVQANSGVGIFYGNGDGTFQAVQQLSVSENFNPTGVIVADINGDGKPDVAVSSDSPISAALLLNNGNRTFQIASYALNTYSDNLAVADLNGDGVQDIALTYGNAIDVLLGQTAFATSLAHASLPGSGSGVVTAKYSGDTHFTGSTSNTLTLPTKSAAAGPYPTTTTLTASGSQGSYQLNASVISSGAGTPTGTVTFTDVTTNTTLGTAAAGPGTTTFTANPSNSFSVGNSDMALGDLNGDGTEDMVVVGYGGFMLALGNGDGTFASPTFVASADPNNGAVAVRLADLNGDGKLDMIAASSNSLSVAVFLGNGDGTFGAENDYPLEGYSSSLAVADFNGDGKLDIAATSSNPSMDILLGKGDGTFQAEHAYPTDPYPQAVTVGDYNGDGKLDAAVSNYGGTISLFLGKGDGTFAAQTLLTGSPSRGNQYSRAIATGDLNGDGKLDLVLSDNVAQAVDVLYGNGNGTFQALQPYPVPNSAYPTGVIVADINGDGKPDIAVSATNVFLAVVLLNNGNKTFQTTGYVRDATGATSLAVGDLNGDGFQDIVLLPQGTSYILLGETAFTTSLAHLSLPGSGSDTVTAKYSGDTHFAASTSNTLTLATMSAVTATPAFSPAAGTYTEPIEVTLADATPGAAIYYTTNGSTPTTASASYTGVLRISSPQTIKAIAVATGYNTSAVASATYIFPAATPTITLASGTYKTPTSTTITDDAGTKLFYCTSTSGNCTPATAYTTAVAIHPSPYQYVCAYGTATGFVQSATVCNAYTDLTPASTPSFSVPPGGFTSPQTVMLTDATAGAAIYYTTDGSTPTTASTRYTAAITVSATETIQAIAAASGFSNSNVASATYSIYTLSPTPTITLASGTYVMPTSTTVTGSAGENLIYCTSTLGNCYPYLAYSSAVTINTRTTEYLCARGTASGDQPSLTVCHVYNNAAAAAPPTFSPAAGTYTSAQTVKLADTTTGAAIYYTTDGSTPTTTSTKYTAAITVSATETINAIAVASGLSNSSVASAAYTISIPAATPTFSLPAGTYSTAQTITLADATTGATIYYTTDGTAPTTASTPYTAAITVSATEKVEAIAVAPGYVSSPIAHATFTIATLAATPTITLATGTYTMPTSTTITGSAGTNLLYCTSSTGNCTPGTPNTSAVTIDASPTEYLCAYATATGFAQSATVCHVYKNAATAIAATPTFSMPAGAYTGTQTVALADVTPGASIYYTTNGTAPTTASTPYTAAITVNATEKIEAIAVAPGYGTSSIAHATFTIN